MDLTYPVHAVIPTLEGPVLAVLARTTRPLTGREIHRLAGTGSANGVRLALARLVRQGVVSAEERAAAAFYQANRDHLAWPAVEILVGLRRQLLDRLRQELCTWECQPAHASLFGSAARADGEPESDIDILLVRAVGVEEDEAIWAAQVEQLRKVVVAWTGNRCQPFETGLDELADRIRASDPLIEAWRRDAVFLAGQELQPLLRQLRAEGGRK